jgi:regulator of protease activity HflC (stomatin/prohibitin superfamily)
MVNLKYQVGAVVGAFLLLTVLVGGALAWNPVDEGNIEVVKEWGDSTGETLEPGANTIIPIKQSTAVVQVRPQQYTMANEQQEGAEARDDSVEVLTNDGVSVDVDVTVRYRVNKDEAASFYDEYKDVRQAEARLIRPTTQDVLRTEGGDIDTTQIYTGSGQNQMASAVKAALESEAEGTGLIIEAVQIRNIKLPSQYANAVEEKEVEKQNIEKKQNSIQVAEAEAERAITQAEGEAKANEIVAASLKGNPELIKIRYIEALNEDDNTIYVGAGNSGGITLTKDVNQSSA